MSLGAAARVYPRILGGQMSLPMLDFIRNPCEVLKV